MTPDPVDAGSVDADPVDPDPVDADTARPTPGGSRSVGSRVALGLGLAVVLGAVSGGVWAWLAEPAAYVVRPQGAVLSEAEAGQQVQVLVVYVLIGAVVGLLVGLAAGWRARTWLVTPAIVGLTLVAAVLAWRLGTWWGPSMPDRAAVAALSEGDRLPLPLGIGSFAAVLVWPIAALVGLLLSVSVRGDRER